MCWKTRSDLSRDCPEKAKMWKKYTESCSLKWGEFYCVLSAVILPGKSIIPCESLMILGKQTHSKSIHLPIKTTRCMHTNDTAGHWCCGTFLSRTEVLYNTPLSIHRHAGYKKNGVCNHFQREARQGTMWDISSLVLYFTFVFHTHTRLCLRHFSSSLSLFLSVSIFSQ